MEDSDTAIVSDHRGVIRLSDLCERNIPMIKFRRELIAGAILVILSVTAYAASVHLKPPNGEPSFMDKVLVLNGFGELAGLGFGDVVVTMIAHANATATCTNKGTTQAPGQNPAAVTVAGTEVIPNDQIKNGTTPFSVDTKAPTTPIVGAPECPNPNWTEDITDLSFTDATITIQQGGSTVLTISCTFSPATSNGAVPASNVSCTTS
jgi:hypothetical protein